MEILGPGDKIKKLRKAVNLKQEELTDGSITRSLISMIENGKRSLNIQTATIIAEKLNEYYRDLGREITVKYLLESEETQACEIVNMYINTLQSMIYKNEDEDGEHIINVFEKSSQLAEEWGLQKQLSQILVLKGNFYYELSKYDQALTNYINAVEYCIEERLYNDVAKTYIKIGRCYLMMGIFEQAVFYNNRAYDIAVENKTENNEEIQIQSIFNTIICYRKGKKYDLVFKCIRTAKQIKNLDNKIKNNIILMEANNYKDLEMYEEALETYNWLIDKVSNTEDELIAIIYNNMSELYRSIEKYELALSYSQRAVALQSKYNIKLSPIILLELAKCYISLNQMEQGLKSLDKACKLANSLNDYEVLVMCQIEKFKIYKLIKNESLAEECLQKSVELVESNNLKAKRNEVYSIGVEYYYNIDKIQMAKLFLNKLKEQS